MIYRNDPNRFGEALRESLLRFLIITVPSSIYLAFILFLAFRDSESGFRLLWIYVLAAGAMIALGAVMTLLTLKKGYHAYLVEADAGGISVGSSIGNGGSNPGRRIAASEITKTVKNEKGEISLYLKGWKIVRLSRYLMDADGLLAEIGIPVSPADGRARTLVIQYLPVALFMGLLGARFIRDPRFYLVIASGFIVSLVISGVSLIREKAKFRYAIPTLAMYVLLGAIIMRNIVLVLRAP